MKHGQSQHFRVRRLVWLVGVCLVIVLIAVTVEGVQFFRRYVHLKKNRLSSTIKTWLTNQSAHFCYSDWITVGKESYQLVERMA